MGRMKKEITPLDETNLYSTAVTAKERENEMISLAVNLAEQQLRDGTASSQVITHFLKLGTEREKLEREKIQHETRMLEAKAQALEKTGSAEEMFQRAIRAFTMYSGDDND